MLDMARIAVIHPHFDIRGGAEMVCLNVLDTLQYDHEVVLFTAGKVDFFSLNKYYQTNVENVTVRNSPPLCTVIRSVVGSRFGLFTYALLNRHFNRNEDEFDLVISTYNEVTTDRPSILYIHHPLYDRTGLGHDPRSTGAIRGAYKYICSKIARISEEKVRPNTMLVNSEWTGKVVGEIYHVRPKTVYPPVDTSEFSPPPAEQQEHGFVSIGRISPDKNVLRNIKIIEQLREHGYDTHLHLIGPTPHQKYLAEVKDQIENCSFIHLESEISREELVQMIQKHRYGLHGKEHEHFGIVVAELVAGGTVPFIPNSGGQCEIIDDCEYIQYSSVESAVKKVDNVLSSPDLEADIRSGLPDVAERFGQKRFRDEIREIVSRSIKKEIQRKNTSRSSNSVSSEDNENRN
jgi:glycosyltransferase involved in cell wall biosynthesis